MWFEKYEGVETQETVESREINENLRATHAKVEDALAKREGVTEIVLDRYESRMEEEDILAELAVGPYQGYDVEGNAVT